MVRHKVWVRARVSHSLPVRRRGRRLRPHRVLQLAVVRKILIANILAALDTEALRIATRRA
jgi:hypothetical protein